MNRRLALIALQVLLATACTGGQRLPDAVKAPAVVTTLPATAPAITCPAEQVEDPSLTPRTYDPLTELPSPNDLPADSTMATIRKKDGTGKLKVGVSADTLLFGSRNQQTGQIEGFDIDMLKEVAKAIFGVTSDADAYARLEIVVIPYSQRIPKLKSGDVDIVAHTMTINCVRWQQIAFSEEYYHSSQKLLVNLIGGAPQYADLEAFAAAKATVCVPDGSTNKEFITSAAAQALGITYAATTDGSDDPTDEVVSPVDISDCLVLLQQGKVDGITGDDTVLAGLSAQDRSTTVVPEGVGFTSEPYGLGINADRVDFVQFVNAVLEQMRDDGRWQEIYDHWLLPNLGEGTQPTPRYGRPEPTS